MTETSDIVELRLIGGWLNAYFPLEGDSDGDRVLAAADEIERLRALVQAQTWLEGDCDE